MKNRRIVLLICFISMFQLTSYSQVKYPYRFNPEQGMVNVVEQPFREEVCLNGLWKFMPVFSKDTMDTRIPPEFQWDNTPIRIPSPWNVNGFTHSTNADFVDFPSYPKKWIDAPEAWMEKDFTVPDNWKNQRLLLHFEAVAGKAIYYLNGKKIGENFDIFFPHEMDVTNDVNRHGKNILLVKVLAPKLFDRKGKYGHRPYVSGSFWGTYIEGIWQDVYLLAKPSVNIANIFVRPDVAHQELRINVSIQNQLSTPQSININGNVSAWINLAGKSIDAAPEQKSALGKRIELNLKGEKAVTIPAYTTKTFILTQKTNGQLAEWSPSHPNLQGLVLHLEKNGKDIDRKYQRFGWRQYLFDKDTLLLNGKPLHLKGDSWHFMGVTEMTRRYAWAWFKMLKQANANAVRLHAQPYPSFYLDMADQLGICVLDETGIWASDGGPDMASNEFWKNTEIHVQHLVLRDRNHPSVFGWECL